MTPRQKRFVEEYVRLKNAREAAIAAGYSARSAVPIASKTMRHPEVMAALIEAGVELVGFRLDGTRTQYRPGLSERQTRFVEQYLVLGNAAEAARRAGYSAHSISEAVTRLMQRSPRVKAAIAEARAKRAARLQIDADHVLAEFARLAFADLGLIVEWDENGLRVKPLAELGPDERAALAQITEQRGKSGSRLSVKLFDKPKALALLAKHLGLFDKGARQQQEQRSSEGDEAREILRERILKLIAAARGEKKD